MFRTSSWQEQFKSLGFDMSRMRYVANQINVTTEKLQNRSNAPRPGLL